MVFNYLDIKVEAIVKIRYSPYFELFEVCVNIGGKDYPLKELQFSRVKKEFIEPKAVKL